MRRHETDVPGPQRPRTSPGRRERGVDEASTLDWEATKSIDCPAALAASWRTKNKPSAPRHAASWGRCPKLP